MIEAFAAANSTTNSILLRYFNPAGAHPTGLIGELPIDKPQNLTPILTQSAIGKLPGFTVFGDNYETRDGSCIRDFIHVCDLANAHTKAIQFLIAKRNSSRCEVFNLGSGNGVSVLEAIKSFENSTGIKLNYKIGERRPGDVIAIYANNEKARKILNWIPKFPLDEIMTSAWKWEQILGKMPLHLELRPHKLN
jgi:UDP-glucose 4-epimerase